MLDRFPLKMNVPSSCCYLSQNFVAKSDMGLCKSMIKKWTPRGPKYWKKKKKDVNKDSPCSHKNISSPNKGRYVSRSIGELG
jgi:hypothetical protein